jgi:thiamine biosynthesis protein ThiS
MRLVINGEDREFSAISNLAALLDHLEMKADRVAVELNRDLVPRDRWGATQLSDGDRLEIVHFVGGGSSPPVTLLVTCPSTLSLIVFLQLRPKMFETFCIWNV